MTSASSVDESDAPTRAQIYVGLEWSKDIIVAARAQMQDDNDRLLAACNDMVAAFERHDMAGIKQATERGADIARAIRQHSTTIRDFMSVLSKKSQEHLNRRPRP
jgi:hypothetical protein